MHLPQKIINLYWYNDTSNFGDQLNPYLIPKLFNVCIKWKNYTQTSEKYFSIGSILSKADRFTKVWGSGFISQTSKLISVPQIYAVRGPLTHAKLTAVGISAPKVFGDPALLLPQVYSPKINKKYLIGVIPHYVDKKSIFIKSISNKPNIKIIDVQNKNIESTINDILSCDIILSSSLHGLIVADAYNIPNIWIKISNGVLGEGFKFNDYFKSVSRKTRSPIIANSKLNIFKLINEYSDEPVTIDLSLLLKSNPFI